MGASSQQDMGAKVSLYFAFSEPFEDPNTRGVWLGRQFKSIAHGSPLGASDQILASRNVARLVEFSE